jgi:rSAM/selenodomain-associated transferase 1
MRRDRFCVVVFGREPAPGRSKTRLAAGVGGTAAARIYTVTLENTLDVAVASGARVILSLASVPSGAWVRDFDAFLELQPPGDLGDRMADAFSRRFAEGEDRVMIVGSDCPYLATQHLRGAAVGLDDSDVVLGPASDGGYWLVAQRAPGVDLFSSIPWSSHNTLQRTQQRLDAIGASWSLLEELADIDTAEDFEAAIDDPRTPGDLARRLLEALKG